MSHRNLWTPAEETFLLRFLHFSKVGGQYAGPQYERNWIAIAEQMREEGPALGFHRNYTAGMTSARYYTSIRPRLVYQAALEAAATLAQEDEQNLDGVFDPPPLISYMGNVIQFRQVAWPQYFQPPWDDEAMEQEEGIEVTSEVLPVPEETKIEAASAVVPVPREFKNDLVEFFDWEKYEQENPQGFSNEDKSAQDGPRDSGS